MFGRSLRWIAPVAALTWIVGACREGGREPDTISERMTGHFDQVTLIRHAVIDGDLGRVHEASRTFADQRMPRGLSSELRAYLRDMRRVTRDLANASDLGAAAAGVGRLARACGSCHEASNAWPGFPIDAAELDDAALPSALETVPHMHRHGWAVARLWEGLIGPSDRRWSWGAKSLETAALRGENLTRDETTVNLSRLAVRVHEIGMESSHTADPDRRAELFAELLATCSACHSAIPR